jgi:DNA-binding GntR family transcriptional regulator
MTAIRIIGQNDMPTNTNRQRRDEHPHDSIHAPSLYLIIQKRILTGRYLPGSRIREVDLQHEFGISNGPVREALQLATADGLVERAPFRGVRVIELNDMQLVELFQVRQILLGAAAELAARRASPSAIASAADLKKRFLGDVRGDAVAPWSPGDLSRWVFDHAGNQRLAESYRRPLLQSLIYVNAALNRRGPFTDVLGHYVVELIDAIAAGDPAAARHAAYELTSQTLRELDLPGIEALHGDSDDP